MKLFITFLTPSYSLIYFSHVCIYWRNTRRREAIIGLKKWADKNIDYKYLIYPADKSNISSRKIAESLGGKVVSEGIKESPFGKKLDEVVYHIPNLKVVTTKQIYQMLSKICDLLNKNNVQYLVYGSVAQNLLSGLENNVHDIDIIVKESDFDKIKKILPDSFNPIQTEFSIHANSKEYLGSDGKPFDVSFDSYEHYFQKDGININEAVKKEINGILISILPLESLKRTYEKYPKGSNEFYDPRLVAIYNTVCPIDEYKDFYLELAKKLSAKTIIDIGCGTGLLTCELEKQGHHMIGVEPSKLMLEVARGSECGKQVKWVEGDALCLKDFNADLAIMTGHVAQFHVDDEYWLKALKSIHKALRPGGYLAFESRNPDVQHWNNPNQKKNTDWYVPNFHKDFNDPKEGKIEYRATLLEVDGELVTSEGHYLFTETNEELTSANTLIFRTRDELEQSLKNTGFSIEKVYGNWDWSIANEKSPEFISVAKKN